MLLIWKLERINVFHDRKNVKNGDGRNIDLLTLSRFCEPNKNFTEKSLYFGKNKTAYLSGMCLR